LHIASDNFSKNELEFPKDYLDNSRELKDGFGKIIDVLSGKVTILPS